MYTRSNRNRYALVATVLGAAGCAAQVQYYGATPPQYYSYELCPSPSTGYVYDPRFESMLRTELSPDSSATSCAHPSIDPGTCPHAAAIDTFNKLWARAVTEQNIDPQNICITLQNFGGKGPDEYRNAAFSLLRDSDKVDLSQTSLSDPDKANFALLQPWMQTAVGDYNSSTHTWGGGAATQWMADYLDDLETQISLIDYLNPAITRVHAEVETTLTGGTYDNRIIQVMLACAADSRWSTRPVPGYDGKTMEQIWKDAQDFYGWKESGQYVTLASKLVSALPGDSSANQPYVAWWMGVCRRAMDGAIKITCFDVVKAHSLTSQALVSNYDNANMDMGVSTFGHRDLSDDAVDNPVPTWYRGEYDIGVYGMYPQPLTTTNPPLAFGLWARVASGDFDSPYLYYEKVWGSDGVVNPAIEDLRQRRWYEPPDPVTGLQPVETWLEYFRRTERHKLDAILSTSTRAPEGVVPWISLPNLDPAGWDEGTSEIITAKIDDTRRALALIRSKDIHEVNMFGNKQPNGRGDLVDWEEFRRADAQVFTNTYETFDVLRGNDISAATPPGNPECIMNTRYDVTYPYAKIVSVPVSSGGGTDVTEIVVTFDEVRPSELGNNGRLVLECQVAPNESSEVVDLDVWRQSVLGVVYIWRTDLEQWEPLSTIGGDGKYAFYVADISTRREWDLFNKDSGMDLCTVLDDGDCDKGSLRLKFVHLAPSTSSGFVSMYDLVQFYHIDDVGAESRMSMTMGEPIVLPGADFNFDDVQDATDAALFTIAWTNGDPGADYNADGEIDALDLTQFLGALSRATSAGGSSEW